MSRKLRPRRPSSSPPVPGDAEGRAGAEALRYATGYHAPVLAREVVDGLVTRPDGVYVDGTLGGGGHAAALLDALGLQARVIGLDRDAAAIATASARLAGAVEAGRFQAVRTPFADVEAALARLGVEAVDGVLLDLGVSSHQIDEAARGFAFGAEGPLDMRMDSRQPTTAADLVNALSEDGLVEVLRTYGEEPRARAVARAVLRRRPLATTAELADVVRGAVPFKEEKKTLARVFQALRIAVNGELEQLERALEAAARVLRPGGRLAVIAYHSLEDRRAKRFLRFGNFEGFADRDFYGHVRTPWTLLTRHAIAPTDAEVAANPRARSARLRIAEKAAPAAARSESPDPRDSGKRGGAAPGR